MRRYLFVTQRDVESGTRAVAGAAVAGPRLDSTVHTGVWTTCGQPGDGAVRSGMGAVDPRTQCDVCLIRLVSSVTWL